MSKLNLIGFITKGITFVSFGAWVHYREPWLLDVVVPSAVAYLIMAGLYHLRISSQNKT